MSARAGPRVIAGFGRSGTTWVQDVLATANSLRAVFEPLHPIVIPDETIHPYCYRDGEVDDPALYRFLHKYFYEDFHSLWVDYRVIWPKLLPAQADLWSRHALKRVLNYNIQAKNNFLHFRDQRRHKQRIIKFVRANLILSWLQKVFGARIVFIIRHPAPVVASQMRASRSWDPQQNLARYRGDSQLLDVLNDGLKKLLFRSLDGVEAYALSWCVENASANAGRGTRYPRSLL
jgi:hypothetical protein